MTDRSGEDEFKLSTRYTAVFNACDVEGMPEIKWPENEDIRMDEMVQKLSEGMGVQILLDGKDQAYYSPHQDQIHLPTQVALKMNMPSRQQRCMNCPIPPDIPTG